MDNYNAEKKQYLEKKSASDKRSQANDERSAEEQSITYAFVVFKTQRDMNRIVELHRTGILSRGVYRSSCCRMCCTKKHNAMKNMYFTQMKSNTQKWLEVQRACEPDEIMWQNLGYSGASHLFRKFNMWMLALSILVIAIFAIVQMSAKAEKLKSEFNTEAPCTGKGITPRQAYDDYTVRSDSQGLMHCFCTDLMKENLKEAVFYTFKFADVKPEDTRKYCQDVKWIQMQGTIVIYGTAFVIVAINTLTQYIFDKTAGYEKHHTRTSTALSLFDKIVMMQFINIALIILFV